MTMQTSSEIARMAGQRSTADEILGIVVCTGPGGEAVNPPILTGPVYWFVAAYPHNNDGDVFELTAFDEPTKLNESGERVPALPSEVDETGFLEADPEWLNAKFTYFPEVPDGPNSPKRLALGQYVVVKSYVDDDGITQYFVE